MAYLHGAYGDINAAGNRVAAQTEGVIVAIGTAPVHTVAGGAANVNKPVLVTGIAEARQLFGYSDDWAKYTLCEAMHVFFELNGVGPLVLINVLDPATHKKSGDATSKSLTPVNGVITIANAEGIILDTVAVAGKTKGTDFTVAYNQAKKTIVITGNLGTAAINVSYNEINAAAVTDEAVIGSTDGMGLNTGVYALKNVYQETGLVPAFVIAPGFSSVPAIHSAMAQVTRKINGHWDAWMFVDLPILNGETPVTMATAATFKAARPSAIPWRPARTASSITCPPCGPATSWTSWAATTASPTTPPPTPRARSSRTCGWARNTRAACLMTRSSTRTCASTASLPPPSWAAAGCCGARMPPTSTPTT